MVMSEESQTGRNVEALQTGQRAIMIANPKAGSYNQEQIEDTLTYLRNHHWTVDLRLTASAGDAQTLAREAVDQKMNAVIAVGGDGTINEVIQALAGSETALGVLPGGTINVWAREVGIPLDNRQAREILINGQVRRIDLGQVNERYFLLMATIGLDAEIAHTVEKGPIKRLGIAGYLLFGTWLGLGYPNFTATLLIGKQLIRTRALQIVFGNTQLYAGAIRLTWRARCDDGLLDISVIRNQNAFGRILLIADFLLGKKKRRLQWVRYETAEAVRLYTSRAAAIQTDGDPAGYTGKGEYTPTILRIAPGALKVIVPQQLPADLFSQP